jgi:hypothetical protein
MTVIAYVGDENHNPGPERLNRVYRQFEKNFEDVVVVPYWIEVEKLEEEDFENIRISNPENFLEKVKTHERTSS